MSIVDSNGRADWRRLKEDWTDYVTVQDLTSRSDPVRTSLFRLALGTEGEKLLRAQLTPEGQNPEKVATLLNMMEITNEGQFNDTYERYVFRYRFQKPDERFNTFLTALRELIKTCEICDHILDTFLKDQ